MDNKLNKVNRVLVCNVTGREITVKPDKYKKLFDYYGSHQKVKDNFICYHVETQLRSPSLSFWFVNCIEVRPMVDELISIFEKFKESKREPSDIQTVQTEMVAALDKNKLNLNTILQKRDDKGGYISGVVLGNVPVVKTIKLELL